MKLVIFGLTVSSSWGNGHATLWRGLCEALWERGHHIVFYERDTKYYASHRDLPVASWGRLEIYESWRETARKAERDIADADVCISTSYCPDALPASEAMYELGKVTVFYDLDTPVTLSRINQMADVDYIGPNGLREFDLVLSYTGGDALTALQTSLGAKRVAPLYGSFDPGVHRPVKPIESWRSDLSYLGTYAEDRQDRLSQLFLEPAAERPDWRFAVAGAQYPADFPWTANVLFFQHLEPAQHASFFCSSRATVNVTRRAMAAMGRCPSGRLFEAAGCSVPIISDNWEGIEEFFEPGREILIANGCRDVLAALNLTDGELQQIGKAARERALSDHTAAQRAEQLERILDEALCAPILKEA